MNSPGLQQRVMEAAQQLLQPGTPGDLKLWALLSTLRQCHLVLELTILSVYVTAVSSPPPLMHSGSGSNGKQGRLEPKLCTTTTAALATYKAAEPFSQMLG